jgi:hypothetical protein
MKTILSDQFKGIGLEQFQIKIKDVKSTIASPLKTRQLQFKQHKVDLFLSQLLEDECHLLIITCYRNGDRHVELGFRILSDWLYHLPNQEPMAVLKFLVSEFGIPLNLGKHSGKFWYRERVQVPTDLDDPHSLIDVRGKTQHSGMSYLVGQFENRGSTKFLNIGLAFAIDTHLYTSSVLRWEEIKPVDLSGYNEPSSVEEEFLVPSPVSGEDIIARITNIESTSGQDTEINSDLVKYFAACKYLRNILGVSWLQSNVPFTDVKDASILLAEWHTDIVKYAQLVRVIQFADFIHRSRLIPGVKQRLDEAQEKEDPIDSLWFEFFVSSSIRESGYEVLRFIPPSAERKTPDLLIQFQRHKIPVEIKAKQFNIAWSRRTLLNPMKAAASQLPDSGPGLIFIMIPEHWLGNSSFLHKAEDVIKGCLQRNRNCNGVFVYWPANIKLPKGEFTFTWRFQHFLTWTPMAPIKDLKKLIRKAEFTQKRVGASFMDDAV